MDPRYEFPRGSCEVADHDREGEGRIFYGDERCPHRTIRDAVGNNDNGCGSREELAVIFVVAKETDVLRAGSVERGHASQGEIKFAPDDVTTDPTSEF